MLWRSCNSSRAKWLLLPGVVRLWWSTRFPATDREDKLSCYRWGHLQGVHWQALLLGREKGTLASTTATKGMRNTSELVSTTTKKGKKAHRRALLLGRQNCEVSSVLFTQGISVVGRRRQCQTAAGMLAGRERESHTASRATKFSRRQHLQCTLSSSTYNKTKSINPAETAS